MPIVLPLALFAFGEQALPAAVVASSAVPGLVIFAIAERQHALHSAGSKRRVQGRKHQVTT